MPVCGAMVMNIGCSPIRLMGAKSAGTAMGMLGAAPFIVTNAEETGMNSVAPSGGALAAVRAASAPPAPG